MSSHTPPGAPATTASAFAGPGGKLSNASQATSTSLPTRPTRPSEIRELATSPVVQDQRHIGQVQPLDELAQQQGDAALGEVGTGLHRNSAAAERQRGQDTPVTGQERPTRRSPGGCPSR